MNGFDLVVPVAEGSAPCEECMESLRRHGGDVVRVVSAAFTWQARQHAIEESVADVIAFVDPDVVVGDRWLAALRLAWDSAPRSIAAIGGPIRGDAPQWAHGRLGLVDLGDEVVDLDPLERTLFAGNLSFRRRALVAAGGLEPPVDRRDGLDWLSEEHEAQRQLGHWGWLVRYAPGMAGTRVNFDARPLTRSWRYGLRTGVAGSRDVGTAFRQGVRSGAGSAGALVRGRRDAAVEKAARAAENFGVIAGSQRRRAPGRTAAHPAPDAPRVTSTTEGVVEVTLALLYHRFAEGGPDPIGLCVSPSNFEEQLAVLRNEYDVVPLAQVAEALAADETNGGGRIAITIDDGYVDNLTTGVPLIVAAGLPATLFASTAHIETGRRFFWDEMQRLLTGPGSRPKQLELDGQTWATATADDREHTRKELHRLFQPRSWPEIEQALEVLREWAAEAAGEPPESTRPLTVDELRRLADTPGLEIGAHTRDHVNLGHQSADEIRAQVERSRDDLAAWLGSPPRAFSYPFGIPRHDVTDDARSIVARAGFRCAVVNQPVPVEARDDVFAIPRLVVPDVGGDEFRAWLERVRR